MAARRVVPTKDLGRTDEDGYFFHGGRADDVIISAGWTMSAVEIEDALLKHPDVREVGVIGVPDELRGQVVKAFVVTDRQGDDAFAQGDPGPRARAPQPARVSAPVVEFVAELPKTPAGKVNRKVLRERKRSQGSRKCLTTMERELSQDHRGGPRRRCASASARRSADTLEPWCHEATRDNIRHYAHGIGDDNPLWCDAGVRGEDASSAT